MSIIRVRKAVGRKGGRGALFSLSIQHKHRQGDWQASKAIGLLPGPSSTGGLPSQLLR